MSYRKRVGQLLQCCSTTEQSNDRKGRGSGDVTASIGGVLAVALVAGGGWVACWLATIARCRGELEVAVEVKREEEENVTCLV